MTESLTLSRRDFLKKIPTAVAASALLAACSAPPAPSRPRYVNEPTSQPIEMSSEDKKRHNLDVAASLQQLSGVDKGFQEPDAVKKLVTANKVLAKLPDLNTKLLAAYYNDRGEELGVIVDKVGEPITKKRVAGVVVDLDERVNFVESNMPKLTYGFDKNERSYGLITYPNKGIEDPLYKYCRTRPEDVQKLLEEVFNQSGGQFNYLHLPYGMPTQVFNLPSFQKGSGFNFDPINLPLSTDEGASRESTFVPQGGVEEIRRVDIFLNLPAIVKLASVFGFAQSAELQCVLVNEMYGIADFQDAIKTNDREYMDASVKRDGSAGRFEAGSTAAGISSLLLTSQDKDDGFLSASSRKFIAGIPIAI